MRTDDLLWRYLKRLPAGEALLQAIQARYASAFELAEPRLDLQDLAQVGELVEHVERGSLGTVLDGSLLASAADPAALLRQVAELLRPPDPALNQEGGLLVLAVPSEHFGRFLLMADGFQRMGLDRAATAYQGWFGQRIGRLQSESMGVWHRRLSQAGLQVVTWQYALSATAVRRLEWAQLMSFPARVSRTLFGRPVIAPWRSSLQPVERWLRPCYEEPAPERGGLLLIVARRVALRSVTQSLPAASPVEYPEEEVALPESFPADARVAPFPITPADSGDVPDSVSESALVPGRTSRVGSLVWLGLALLLALVGQLSWNWSERPQRPGDGLLWYGMALFCFAIFIWQSSPPIRLSFPAIHLALGSPRTWVRDNFAPLMLLFWAMCLSVFAWSRVQDEVIPAHSATGALLWWVAAIFLALIALWPGALERLLRFENRLLPNRRPMTASQPAASIQFLWKAWSWWELAAVAGLVLAAFLIRFIQLADIPYVLAGDEANMGMEAVRILKGRLANPFVTGWFSHPTLFFYLQSLPIELFGNTTFGVRFLSPLVGAITVLAAYLFARRAWGKPVAFAAAILLSAYHFHIHYSRLGLNNIWDPLFALVVMGLFWQGWERDDRRCYVLGGLVLGISQYFYMGSRLLLVMLGVALVYIALNDWRRLWAQRGNLAAALLMAAVVAIPITFFSLKHPNEYMARVNQLGIFQSGWLDREIVITGQSRESLLWLQFWKSALAFNYTVDPTFWYRPEIPLLRFLPSILFVFGLGLALVGIKRMPNFFLLLWVGATVIFAGVLLENPPSSQRYLIVAPALCFLVALALVWLAKRLQSLLGGQERIWLGGVLLISLWIAQGDLRFYFADYTHNGDFGGINTEVANRVADYYQAELGREWEVYFFGPPRMGISPHGGFPSVPYLIPEAKSMDVLEPIASINDLPQIQRPAVFIFLPERVSELAAVQDALPNGVEKHFPGRYNRMLFIAYEYR